MDNNLEALVELVKQMRAKIERLTEEKMDLESELDDLKWDMDALKEENEKLKYELENYEEHQREQRDYEDMIRCQSYLW